MTKIPLFEWLTELTEKQLVPKLQQLFEIGQGVHTLDVNFEKSEVKVIGTIDAKKISERIQKISKRKVEITKVEADFKETIVVQKVVKEIKQVIIHSTTIKAHMHCDGCEARLRKKLLRHKAIFGVKSDMKAQTITIEGSMEAEKLVAFIRKKVQKHAELVSTKQLGKEEGVKKETEKVSGVKEVKETKKVIDVKEVKEVEEKLKASKTPYIIHYVYAPQWFSDEDPNSCCIM